MPIEEEVSFPWNFEGEGDISKESQEERAGEAGPEGARGSPEPVARGAALASAVSMFPILFYSPYCVIPHPCTITYMNY